MQKDSRDERSCNEWSVAIERAGQLDPRQSVASNLRLQLILALTDADDVVPQVDEQLRGHRQIIVRFSEKFVSQRLREASVVLRYVLEH